MKILHNFKIDGLKIEGQILYVSNFKKGSGGYEFLRSSNVPQIYSKYIYIWGNNSGNNLKIINKTFSEQSELDTFLRNLEKVTLPLAKDYYILYKDNTEYSENFKLLVKGLYGVELEDGDIIDMTNGKTKQEPLREYHYTVEQYFSIYDNIENNTQNTNIKVDLTTQNTKSIPKPTRITKAILVEEIKKLEEENVKFNGLLISKDKDISDCQFEINAIKQKNIDILSEKDKIEKKYNNLKKKLIKPPKRKIDKNKSKFWEDIIISDENYKALKFSFKSKMPLLLRGPSGTGKSSIVRALGDDEGVEVIEYNFNGDTTVENLLGHKILVGGNMIWEDGPLTDAVRNGKIFIAHEINASSPDIQFVLNGLLELNNGNLGKLSVQGNNGEVIIPHQNFRFFGTYNPGYLGTKLFGTSIMSRFIGLDIPPLSIEDEKILLSKKYGKYIYEIDTLVTIEHKLRENKDFTYDISTRDILQALLFIDGGFTIKEALLTCVYNSIQLDIEKLIFNNLLEELGI